MKTFKTNKGITLVALIITIIVLLILTVVAISSITDQGLFTKSQESVNKYEEKREEEKNTLADYASEIDNYLQKEEIIWGEYEGSLVYIGTSEDLIVTSDSIKVQEISVDEETMEYTMVDGTIKTATFANYNYITFALSPNIKTIDFGNKLSENCNIDGYRLENLVKVSGLGGIEKVQECAFMGCTNLEEVIIPEGVATIEGQAFAYCYNLKKITLPSTLTSISPVNFGGDVIISSAPMEITINMTKTVAETTLGTEWIPNAATKIIYIDQEVIL